MISKPSLTLLRTCSNALKTNNILYDRDGEGEYFQVYTQSFEQRFFFEIVERRQLCQVMAPPTRPSALRRKHDYLKSTNPVAALNSRIKSI